MYIFLPFLISLVTIFFFASFLSILTSSFIFWLVMVYSSHFLPFPSLSFFSLSLPASTSSSPSPFSWIYLYLYLPWIYLYLYLSFSLNLPLLLLLLPESTSPISFPNSKIAALPPACPSAVASRVATLTNQINYILKKIA